MTTEITTPAVWNALAAAQPYAHILQSWEWGAFKSRYGWSARRLAWADGQAAAQTLTRAARGLRVLYVPKGPLLNWSDAQLRTRVLDDLQARARREHAIFIKIDPDLPSSAGPPGAEQPDAVGTLVTDELRRRGWRFSPDQIQFRNTVTLDLTRREDEILAGMKQKTRYNIRLAQKKGVQVRAGAPADLDLLYQMYAETARRDSFVIRAADYYREAWGRCMAAGLAQPLIAEVDGQPVSAVIIFKFAQTAWYMYGMSRETHRDKMPNHLLQWEAMRWAKANGGAVYDFWGAPDEFVETDAMWGVWKFKDGFGGNIVRHIGAWDYAPYPWLYTLYTTVIPYVLSVMRWQRRHRTNTAIG